ncbi:hypothetical protein IWQ54_005956 [Labrenzia sp. EL_195]|nr:hypothetical protein [Labrenzia sp. EL_195]
MQFNRNRKRSIHWGVDGRSVDWLRKYLILIIKKLFAAADAQGETGGHQSGCRLWICSSQVHGHVEILAKNRAGKRNFHHPLTISCNGYLHL